jgi:hypothetical protein
MHAYFVLRRQSFLCSMYVISKTQLSETEYFFLKKRTKERPNVANDDPH